jgi:hypothetical protein
MSRPTSTTSSIRATNVSGGRLQRTQQLFTGGLNPYQRRAPVAAYFRRRETSEARGRCATQIFNHPVQQLRELGIRQLRLRCTRAARNYFRVTGSGFAWRSWIGMSGSLGWRDGVADPLIAHDTQSSVFPGYVASSSGVPAEAGAHFRAQAHFCVRSSFFNAASALSASDLLAKASAPSTRTGGLERVNFAPLPLL